MNPIFFNPLGKPVINSEKGRELMEAMLLSQYTDKPNLHEYFMAFFEEADLLYEQIETVYLDRFIEYAHGETLDHLGLKLNEGREINLPTQFFGFDDESGPAPPDVAPMADEATPEDGGIFLSEDQSGFTSYPLSDTQYRNLLLAKAYLSNKRSCSINNAYQAISILLGRVPESFELVDIDSSTSQQLISNPNFVDDTTDWTPDPDYTLGWADGKGVLKPTTAATLDPNMANATTTVLDPAKTYLYSARIRSNADAYVPYVGLEVGIVIRDEQTSRNTVTDDGWTYLSGEYSPSSGETVSMFVGADCGMSTTPFEDIEVEVDQVTLYEKTDPTTVPNRVVELRLSQFGTPLSDIAFISYLAQYFVPLGTTLNIVRI